MNSRKKQSVINFLLYMMSSAIFFCVSTGCDRNSEMRQYKEVIVTQTPEHPHLKMGDGKRSGRDSVSSELIDLQSMKDEMGLPEGHPEIVRTPIEMAEMGSAVQNSMANVPLAWKVPEGWETFPGKGIRLATLKNNGAYPVECSVISLEGMAGGEEANLLRWAGQIGLDLSIEEISRLTQSPHIITSEGGLTVKVYDFTGYSSSPSENQDSILGAVVPLGNKTIFIKMTGTQKNIIQNKDKFLQFCASLVIL